MKRKLIIAALAFGALVSCTKENIGVEGNGETTEVKFSASSITTRTTEIEVTDEQNVPYIADAWEKGDAIGITTTMEVGFNNFDFDPNYKYIATTEETSLSTSFEAADWDNVIYMNRNQLSDINFDAYYPYDPNATENNNYMTTIDLSGQKTDLGAVDFLVANSKWEHGTDNVDTEITFDFKHMLSKVVFEINFLDEAKLEDNGNTLSAKICDVYTKNSYSITNGHSYSNDASAMGDIELKTSDIDVANRTATVTALLHPSLAMNNNTVELLVNGKKFSFQVTLTPKCSKVYTYNIILGRDEVIFGGDKDGEEIKITDWTNTTLEDLHDVNNAQGNGSRNNPFKIRNVQDFMKIGRGSRIGTQYSYADKHYILMNDIVFEEGNHNYRRSPLYDKDGSADGFSGTLNGNGHTITISSIPANDNVSIFEKISENGKVYDLNINLNVAEVEKDVVFSAITAYNAGTIENFHVTGTITSNNYVGCWVADQSNGQVLNCTNDCTVNSTTKRVGVTDQKGTTEDPFQINDLNEFKELGTKRDGRNIDSYYILMNDIEISEDDFKSNGCIFSSSDFEGTLNGNGHKITISSIPAKSNVSIFYGLTNSSKVYDLTVEMIVTEVENDTDVVFSAITPYNTGIIENCHVTGTFTSHGSIGCWIADYSKGQVLNCTNDCILSSMGVNGGIVNTNSGTVTPDED